MVQTRAYHTIKFAFSGVFSSVVQVAPENACMEVMLSFTIKYTSNRFKVRRQANTLTAKILKKPDVHPEGRSLGELSIKNRVSRGLSFCHQDSLEFYKARKRLDSGNQAFKLEIIAKLFFKAFKFF